MRDGLTRLLLIGAGAAHAQVIARLSQQHPAGLQVAVLAPPVAPLHEALLPAVIADRVAAEQARLGLPTRAQAAQVHWIAGQCTGLDLAQRVVHARAAEGGESFSIPFNLLSIDPAPEYRREEIEARWPGARAHALMRYPSEAFLHFWPGVLELARERALSIAVIGSGTAAIELVFALARRLRAEGAAGASFTLVGDGAEPGSALRPAWRRQLLRRLRREGIHLLPQTCVGISAEGVSLDNGALLRCDVPIVATPAQAPDWLASSGLPCDADGRVLVDRFLRSEAHAAVFAVGEAARRAGASALAAPVDAERAGARLAHNLLAAHQCRPLKPQRAAPWALQRLSCGSEYALAALGPLVLQGRWVAQWKARDEAAFAREHHAGDAG